MDVVAGKVLPTKHNISAIDLASRWQTQMLQMVASESYGGGKGSINDFIASDGNWSFGISTTTQVGRV